MTMMAVVTNNDGGGSCGKLRKKGHRTGWGGDVDDHDFGRGVDDHALGGGEAG